MTAVRKQKKLGSLETMKRLLGCGLLLLLASGASAQDAVGPDLGSGHRFSLQFLAGFYPSSDLGPGAPFGSTLDNDFDYAPLSVRLGYRINDPSPSGGWLRGSAEVLAELMVAPVTNGYADLVIGPSLLLRYNFVQPGARVHPYIQAGAGLVFSDAYEAEGQDAFGQAVEFLLQTQVGLRWLLNESWSVDFEAGFQHISNAGLADRNAGINNFGGSVGLTWYFPERAR